MTEKKPYTLEDLANEFADGAASAEHPTIRALCARCVILVKYIRRLEHIVGKLVADSRVGKESPSKAEEAPPAEAQTEEEATEEMVKKVQAETQAELAAVKAKANGSKSEAQS